ncbi:hypothetical protein E3N88_22669 [Mikania micrantha]|uniref:Secreted protein n=1 Tax=Mikania micrantha TaxID=192012 RepID=A0A5N6NDM5_9ASTR|nr:hypothetical protein E3N88_22669 [Mikania micrantha]
MAQSMNKKLWDSHHVLKTFMMVALAVLHGQTLQPPPIATTSNSKNSSSLFATLVWVGPHIPKTEIGKMNKQERIDAEKPRRRICKN